MIFINLIAIFIFVVILHIFALTLAILAANGNLGSMMREFEAANPDETLQGNDVRIEFNEQGITGEQFYKFKPKPKSPWEQYLDSDPSIDDFDDKEE